MENRPNQDYQLCSQFSIRMVTHKYDMSATILFLISKSVCVIRIRIKPAHYIVHNDGEIDEQVE